MGITFFLKVSDKQTLFKNRGFYCADPAIVSHLEMIGKKFLKGYHASLVLKNNDDLCSQLKHDSNDYAGFLYEGASMAKTILDFISLHKKSRVKRFISHPTGNLHIYMLHVGAGWGFARLPVSIEKKIQQYDPLLRWLIIDGYGFHQAYFKTKKYVYQMQLPKQLKEPYSLKVFYQGVGRCLWFVDCGSAERIAKRISGFPSDYHGDLWSGVGLASAYAGGVSERELIALKKLSGLFVQHFTQGAVFAAKARERACNITAYNELACKIICEMTVVEAASLCDSYCEKVPDKLSSAEKYEWWRQSIRTAFLQPQKQELKHAIIAG